MKHSFEIPEETWRRFVNRAKQESWVNKDDDVSILVTRLMEYYLEFGLPRWSSQKSVEESSNSPLLIHTCKLCKKQETGQVQPMELLLGWKFYETIMGWLCRSCRTKLGLIELKDELKPTRDSLLNLCVSWRERLIKNTTRTDEQFGQLVVLNTLIYYIEHP